MLIITLVTWSRLLVTIYTLITTLLFVKMQQKLAMPVNPPLAPKGRTHHWTISALAILSSDNNATRQITLIHPIPLLFHHSLIQILIGKNKIAGIPLSNMMCRERCPS